MACFADQDGDAFVAAASAYVRRPLRRGVTSLFSDLKPLYRDAAKAAHLEAVMEAILASLQSSEEQLSANGDVSLAKPSEGASNSAAAQPEDDGSAAAEEAAASPAQPPSDRPDGPQTQLWVMFYLAQHYDRLGRTGKLVDHAK